MGHVMHISGPCLAVGLLPFCMYACLWVHGFLANNSATRRCPHSSTTCNLSLVLMLGFQIVHAHAVRQATKQRAVQVLWGAPVMAWA